ncbi:MAG: WD40 repeat domain-containing protein [Planctomycetes bacterium]|nr:WD40 repeat domain-containing protein [Planctomycetota bacterium]
MWVQRVGGTVSVIAYSRDSTTLFTHDGGAWVYAWDIAARARRKLLKLEDGERGSLYRDRFSVVGDRYLILEPAGWARGWDTVASAPLADLPNRFGYGAARPAHTGSAVQYIATDRKGIETYEVVTGTRTRTHAAPPDIGPLSKFAVAPDGRAVLIGGSAHTALVRADGSSERLPDSYCDDVRFSPDGRSLVWMHGGAVRICDADTLAERVPLVSCYSAYSTLTIHPTAPLFAVTSAWREFTLFRLDTGEPIRTFDLNIGSPWCACFAPDGLTCAVGGRNKQFAVFDVDV